MSAFVALKGSFTLRGVMWETDVMLTMYFRVSKVTYETKNSVDTYLKYMTTKDSKSNKNKTLAWSLKDSMGRLLFRDLSLESSFHIRNIHACLWTEQFSWILGTQVEFAAPKCTSFCPCVVGWNVLPALALWQRSGLACVGGHSASWDGGLLWKNTASSDSVAGAHRRISPCFPGGMRISHLIYPWDLQSNQELLMTNFWPEEFFMEHFIFAWYMVQVDSCICAIREISWTISNTKIQY